MNHRDRTPLRSFLLIAGAALVAAPAAAAPVNYVPAASEVWVEGTSTLHDWRVAGEAIHGEVRVDPEDLLQGSTLAGRAAARVSVPVKGLKSGKPKMDALMYQALEAEDHPSITYELDEVRWLSRQDDGGHLLEVKGRLAMAGETRPVTLRATARIVDGGGLLIEGSTPLRMTSFGIDPPTALLGTIKTGDEVRVGFRWTLTPETAPEGR